MKKMNAAVGVLAFLASVCAIAEEYDQDPVKQEFAKSVVGSYSFQGEEGCEKLEITQHGAKFYVGIAETDQQVNFYGDYFQSKDFKISGKKFEFSKTIRPGHFTTERKIYKAKLVKDDAGKLVSVQFSFSHKEGLKTLESYSFDCSNK